MQHNWTSKVGPAVFTGLLTGAAVWATPAQAGPLDESFLSRLAGAGVNVGNPVDTVALGQQICPMLNQPASTVASTASNLGMTKGISPEIAGMFATIAVSMYCPQMLSQLTSGHLPELPQIPGMTGPPGIPGIPGMPGATAAPGLSIPIPGLAR